MSLRRVPAFPFYLLGRDVIRRSHGLRQLGERQAARARIAGDAEVDQLDVVVLIHHDVFRLQVAVHHAVVVNVFERVADASA